MEIMKLESTILSVAHRALAEFKSYAEDGLLDEAMMRFHEIGGLTILGRIQNSGVSKETAAELDLGACGKQHWFPSLPTPSSRMRQNLFEKQSPV